MRKFGLAALAAAAILGASTGAQAATVITVEIAPGASSGTFQSGVGIANQVSCDSGPIGCSGDFTAMGSFAAQAGFQLVGATLTTGPATTTSNDINFLTATLNGEAFTLTSLGGGTFEFGTLNPITLQALNTLMISGTTGGQGTFSGTLTFAQGVPEPGTWAMMLLGFGAIGVGMRRRRSATRMLAQLA